MPFLGSVLGSSGCWVRGSIRHERSAEMFLPQLRRLQEKYNLNASPCSNFEQIFRHIFTRLSRHLHLILLLSFFDLPCPCRCIKISKDKLTPLTNTRRLTSSRGATGDILRPSRKQKLFKTSVTSFEYNPCKSRIASVLSSAVALPSPTWALATPKHTPSPPPHDFPLAPRSPGSSDQLASQDLTACSESLARSPTSLAVTASTISAPIFAFNSCPSLLNLFVAAPSPRLHASAARDKHALRAAPRWSARGPQPAEQGQPLGQACCGRPRTS